MEDMMVKRMDKAEEAMVRAIQYFDGVSLDGMTEAERKLHHDQKMVLEALYASHRQLEDRIRRIEDIIKSKPKARNPLFTISPQ
jgi:hypothetical protein